MNTVSVIIPTLNEEKYLPLLLQDLARQSRVPKEVLVVDGSSTDATVRLAKQYPEVTVISTHSGVGHQRQLGLKAATGKYLIFFDADVRIHTNFVKDTINFMDTHQINCACPYYLPTGYHPVIWSIYVFFNSLFWLAQWRIPSGAGSCIAVKRTHAKKVRFNTSLLNDDLDFIYRAGNTSTFRMLPTYVRVSDRRFKEYGIFPTLWKYIQISFFFLTGSLQKANSVTYTFGRYKK